MSDYLKNKNNILTELRKIEDELDIKFTHKASVTSGQIKFYLKIYKLYSKNKNIKLFINKSFAFYTFIYIFLKKDFKEVIVMLNSKFQFNSVITDEMYQYLRTKYDIPDACIEYTLGSSLSVVLGESYLPSSRLNIVYIPDSLLLFGEFWEGLNIIKNYNYINSEIHLYLDFNNKNKLTTLKYSKKELIKLFESFKHPKIKYKILKS